MTIVLGLRNSNVIVQNVLFLVICITSKPHHIDIVFSNIQLHLKHDLYYCSQYAHPTQTILLCAV